MTKILRALRWPAVILSIFFAIAGALLASNPQWVRIEAIDIEISNDSKEALLFERIRTTLAQQFRKFEGKYFWQVPLTEIYELTGKDKRVKSASVFREFPSRLRVQVEPRTPLLAYLSGDGRISPVASDGTLLPPIAFNDASNLPILRGEELKDEPRLRELALNLLASIPDQGSFSKKSISEIVYTRKDGFKVYVSDHHGEVKFGDSDFGPKVSRIQKVFTYLDSRGLKGRVIDARFSKKVLVRSRNTP